MPDFDSGDSPLSVTGSIVGIVALLVSVSTILQALLNYCAAYRDAPAELDRIISTTSNTIDENSYRLRASHVPGPVFLDLGKTKPDTGRWTDMLQEYFDAHMELDEEISRLKDASARTNSLFNRNRLLWLFRRKDLEESVKRVETLRLRKMAVALNALVEDVGHMRDVLDRIESRIPEGPLRLPPSKPPQEPDPITDLARPLNLYSSSVMGESVTNIVRPSFDSS